jgi:hypothetical protein
MWNFVHREGKCSTPDHLPRRSSWVGGCSVIC